MRGIDRIIVKIRNCLSAVKSRYIFQVRQDLFRHFAWLVKKYNQSLKCLEFIRYVKK